MNAGAYCPSTTRQWACTERVARICVERFPSNKECANVLITLESR